MSPVTESVAAPSCMRSTSARYGRVGAAQREYAPLAVFVGEQQRVDLAAVDGLQIAFRLEQARAQFLDVELLDIHAGTSAEAPGPAAAARDSTCHR